VRHRRLTICAIHSRSRPFCGRPAQNSLRLRLLLENAKAATLPLRPSSAGGGTGNCSEGHSGTAYQQEQPAGSSASEGAEAASPRESSAADTVPGSRHGAMIGHAPSPCGPDSSSKIPSQRSRHAAVRDPKRNFLGQPGRNQVDRRPCLVHTPPVDRRVAHKVAEVRQPARLAPLRRPGIAGNHPSTSRRHGRSSNPAKVQPIAGVFGHCVPSRAALLDVRFRTPGEAPITVGLLAGCGHAARTCRTASKCNHAG